MLRLPVQRPPEVSVRSVTENDGPTPLAGSMRAFATLMPSPPVAVTQRLSVRSSQLARARTTPPELTVSVASLAAAGVAVATSTPTATAAGAIHRRVVTSSIPSFGRRLPPVVWERTPVPGAAPAVCRRRGRFVRFLHRAGVTLPTRLT